MHFARARQNEKVERVACLFCSLAGAEEGRISKKGTFGYRLADPHGILRDDVSRPQVKMADFAITYDTVR
jgi:hypothetical protein